MSEESKQEDSMTPPDIDACQELDITDIEIGDMNKSFSQIINYGDDIFHEPTCPICSSSARKDAEEKWIDTKKYSDVKTLLKDKADLDVSKVVIKNHMIYHYDRGVKERQKIEYAGRIDRLNSVNLTTLDRIKFGLNALQERIMGINSITPSGDYSEVDIEKIKTSEMSRLMGAWSNLVKMKVSIEGDMKTTGELLTIPTAAFNAFFEDLLINAQTDEEKTTINNVLDGLANIGKSLE